MEVVHELSCHPLFVQVDEADEALPADTAALSKELTKKTPDAHTTSVDVEPTVERHQLSSLPRITQSQAQPTKLTADDVTSSLDAVSSMSSSTALPVDVMETSSRHLSDVQVQRRDIILRVSHKKANFIS